MIKFDNCYQQRAWLCFACDLSFQRAILLGIHGDSSLWFTIANSKKLELVELEQQVVAATELKFLPTVQFSYDSITNRSATQTILGGVTVNFGFSSQLANDENGAVSAFKQQDGRASDCKLRSKATVRQAICISCSNMCNGKAKWPAVHRCFHQSQQWILPRCYFCHVLKYEIWQRWIESVVCHGTASLHNEKSWIWSLLATFVASIIIWHTDTDIARVSTGQ